MMKGCFLIGIFPLSIVIVAMWLALGGAAQIIAGIMEFKKNNTFGATAFTAFMFIGTLKHNRAIQVVFASLTLLFLLLSIANFTGSAAVHTIAGYVGIFCGLSAFYNSMAQIINEEYGKNIMPL